MPNPNAPFGLRPVKMADGSEYVGGGRPYYVPSTDATALYIGDPVVTTGTSNSVEIAASGQTGGAVKFPIGSLPVVTRATNGDVPGTGTQITGVVVRVGYDHNDWNRAPYRKASTNAVVWVEDNPRVLFEIQSDGSNAVTDVGLNAVLIGTGGSTVTGLSNVKLDTTSDVPAADASNQLLIVGVSRDVMRNDLSSPYPVLLVKNNQSNLEPNSVLGA